MTATHLMKLPVISIELDSKQQEASTPEQLQKSVLSVPEPLALSRAIDGSVTALTTRTSLEYQQIRTN
jgi:hypothetical protein